MTFNVDDAMKEVFGDGDDEYASAEEDKTEEEGGPWADMNSKAEAGTPTALDRALATSSDGRCSYGYDKGKGKGKSKGKEEMDKGKGKGKGKSKGKYVDYDDYQHVLDENFDQARYISILERRIETLKERLHVAEAELYWGHNGHW
jgi:hypothetical protein